MKKKEKENPYITSSIKTQLDEFATKFEKDLSMLAFPSTNTNTRIAWYFDSGVSHMIEAQDIFSSLIGKDVRTYVDLSDDSKYASCLIHSQVVHLRQGIFFMYQN